MLHTHQRPCTGLNEKHWPFLDNKPLTTRALIKLCLLSNTKGIIYSTLSTLGLRPMGITWVRGRPVYKRSQLLSIEEPDIEAWVKLSRLAVQPEIGLQNQLGSQLIGYRGQVNIIMECTVKPYLPISSWKADDQDQAFLDWSGSRWGEAGWGDFLSSEHDDFGFAMLHAENG